MGGPASALQLPFPVHEKSAKFMKTWHNLSLAWGFVMTAVPGLAACGGLSGSDAARGSGGAAAGGSTAAGGGTSGGSPSSGGASSSGGQGQGGNDQDRCQALAAEQRAKLVEAERCDPALSSLQCTEEVWTGISCSCPEYANPKNAEAISALRENRAEYEMLGCYSSLIVCGPCPSITRARCSPEGRCEQYRGRSCKVNGVVYPDRTEGIPDFQSCNTCTCEDGSLSCTEINCPTPCPSGTAPGAQCDECGPADECDVLEYGCFPKCTEECEPGTLCSGGVCVGVCG